MAQRGISRKRRKGGKVLVWDYFDPKGKLITNAKVKERCNKLVLPPAWQDVWISVDASAHLQATGVDARGRLQYRYHAAWTAARAEEKFNGMTRFAKMLPRIRRKVDADLKLEGMPRDKVVALIVKLIDIYHFRVGNDEYAKSNKSYGLTTLKEGHVTFDWSKSAEGEFRCCLRIRG